MKWYCAFLLLTLAAVACGPAVVTTRPVEPVVIVPASPGPGYVWINGYWQWDRRAHVHHYVNGYWTRPARPGAVWVGGGWHQARGGWRYSRGYWR